MAAVKEEKGDTSRVDLQQAMFDELRDIGHRVKDISERLVKMEKKVGQVVTDLHTIHQDSQSSNRCVSIPL